MTHPVPRLPKRVLTDEEIKNRFGYHKPASNIEIMRHEELRRGFIAFCEYLNDKLPDGRAKSTAMSKLQECSMWAHFRVAELSPVVDQDQPPQQETLFSEVTVTDDNVPPYAQ